MNIAVVTGASSGMGREFVLQLSSYVAVDEIWVIARRADALAALQSSVSVPLKVISLDLSKEESFASYAGTLAAEQPNVKLLVNAAGFGKFGSFEKIPLEDEMKMVDLNCKALLAMTRLTLPYMAAGSHILQLDSLSAFQPVPYITTYGATKAMVLSYSRAMNQELKAKGIRMMSMNPGWVRTEFFDHALQTNEGNEVQYYDRISEADEVVATGLKDLYKTQKDFSIHGFMVRAQVQLVKHLPHGVVMRIWLNQQKKAKNNTNLKTK
jgi:short-subunit dehydrogenase